ncbi:MULTISPECIES: acyltransferase [Microbacterium]|uniref:acyltransferase family protein n=1 Tax=Microbacterium TaxID=33882 RepID=UPI00277E2CF5|nr:MULTISPECIES: acyltransferase [Microbacterium]MDQ1084527.1 fucose 4-O-acetylase-like acetyltransferase [Microbacterium sp. SORGH_AS_0344]MDQ1170196.1 fucose 4-O-acetylase-like acetyltransferase [Microbacterium proteolyticum]
MTAETTRAPAQRIAWIDVARGIAITLVVFHHSIQFLDATGWQVGPLVQLTTALSTFRMPLFFLVSGLLASSAIARLSFSSLFWKRLALLVYLYALWCVIWWAWFLFVPRPFDPLTSPVGNLATALYLPWSGLWFLYALILYTAAAWALRRLPRVAQLVIAFAIASLFATGIVTVSSSYTWRSVGTYFALFMTGVLCRQLVEAYARRVTVWWLLATGVVLAAGTIALPSLPLQGVFRVALCVVGAAFGVSIAVMLARSSAARRAVGALGSRTLPIYVLNSLLLALSVALLPVELVPGWLAAVLLTAMVVTVALLIHRAVGPVSGIFTLPAPLQRFAHRRLEADRLGAGRAR